MQTTLNRIRAYQPCKEGWEKLLKHLGKTKADDEQLSLLTILDSNGIGDALWCLRAIEGRDKEIRLYAVWCARQVQHLMKDPRSLAALDVAEKCANGKATEEELAKAEAAARAAARDAARDAAGDAARGASRDAAWGAARGAAWCAAWDVERGAAWDAARCASRDAEKGAEKGAALDAARDAQAARLREVCNEVQGAKQ